MAEQRIEYVADAVDDWITLAAEAHAAGEFDRAMSASLVAIALLLGKPKPPPVVVRQTP